MQVVALITVEVHARDVIDKLGKAGAASPTDFEWVSQLRFYWDKASDNCVVKQVCAGGKGGGWHYGRRTSASPHRPGFARLGGWGAGAQEVVDADLQERNWAAPSCRY